MAHTILLADDSITIRKVVELSFHGTDIRVESVESGDEALDRLEEIKPDLVLADLVMPGPTGYELCRKIKESDNPVPVLLLRGAFEPFDNDKAEACGSDGYLVKPFKTSVLVESVNRLLQGEPEQEKDEPASEVIVEPDEGTLEAEAVLDEIADEATIGEISVEEAEVDELEVDFQKPEGEIQKDATEKALRMAISAVSEEIIREIAWEVVPELAENLIRERIRELERESSD